MASTPLRPNRSNPNLTTPIRTFGRSSSGSFSQDPNPATPGSNPPSSSRRFLSRLSFSRVSTRESDYGYEGVGGAGGTEAQSPSGKNEQAPIPSAIGNAEEYSTPLPKLSMIVLSITMLGEFLCANVSTPFILFMVEGFDQLEDKAEVALYTGLLIAAFFLSQFLTSLLWSSLSIRYSPRFVISLSLLGSSLTLCVFGTARSLQEAIAIRLLQGVFGGAVGVGRGAVAGTGITDKSNEGRAYAILGFCWGLGGVAGAILGGSLESPANKWPGTFGKLALFVKYPYLLPCIVAACVTLFGSALSLFLAPDCGPRTGRISLPEDKEDFPLPIPSLPSTIPEEGEHTEPPSDYEDNPFDSPSQNQPKTYVGKLTKRLSGYFASRVPREPASPIPVPMASTSDDPRGRTFSRTSRANGSAYGYTGPSSYRARLLSSGATTIGGRRFSNASSMRRRRASGAGGTSEYGSYTGTTGGAAGRTQSFNFAQRMLMANADAVTSIADLWVAAAINADEGDSNDVFESSDDEEEEGQEGPQGQEQEPRMLVGTDIENALDDGSPAPARLQPRHPSTSLYAGHTPQRHFSNTTSTFSPDRTPASRRGSSVTPSVPAIFSHVGVSTPTAVLDAQQLLMRSSEDAVDDGLLGTISEGILLSPESPSSHLTATQHQEEMEAGQMDEKQPSLTSQLPWLVVLQYGMLALHSTTHDQVFLSYVVSEYNVGGLGLNAGHFAQLIALMCLFQIFYQFYLYPNIGPPRGRFSHLAMFRLGSFLFIPAYLTVVLYRVFASEGDDGNWLLMVMLSLSTAVRYCGATFTYTSIAILLNYMTPPDAIGYANGVAQSIVSLARCFGPVLGGYLWSASVEGNPSGYPLGFVVCGVACAVAVGSSYLIR